jgi:hypothetical protein
MATTKKMDVPDIGGLLGKISSKREELPKSPIQSVQPVPSEVDENKAVETAERKTVKTTAVEEKKVRGTGGRPSVKRDDIEYVKISPRIPEDLKTLVDVALSTKRFRYKNGNPIKTLDELTALALARLFSKDELKTPALKKLFG